MQTYINSLHVSLWQEWDCYMRDDYLQQNTTQVELSYMTQDNISWGTSEEFNLDQSNICNYVWQNADLLGWG